MITANSPDLNAGTDTLTVDGAKSALRSHSQNADIDPLINSVFALAVHYFQRLQAGKIDVKGLDELACDVGKELITDRADRFRTQHRLGDKHPYTDLVKERLHALADQGFDDFKLAIEKNRGGIVFTGHPTFALPKNVRDAFAAYAETDPAEHMADEARKNLRTMSTKDSEAWAKSITLALEHAEVQETLQHAQCAMGTYADRIVDVTRTKFPEEWRSIFPQVPSFASWVGYDLDGRDDIEWTDSLCFRLQEKSTQLARYAAQLGDLLSEHGPNDRLSELKTLVENASAHTDKQQQALFGAAGEPNKIVTAANLITEDHPHRLTNVKLITDVLSALIIDPDTADELAADLISMRTMAEASQLGTARIHLRLNAAQMNSVIKRDLGIKADSADIGRVAMTGLAEKTASATPQAVTFADLYLEQTTARRQFMMCSVLLSHVDEGSPIRFLIAESENPATVLSALYLARLYGVSETLDISPLFETPHALISGARFIERLLEEPVYRDYLCARGYQSIQLGFSDAGRFVGQVSADMAIERLHNLIGRAIARANKSHGTNFDLLVFNTHGESMGRGAYPGTFEDRLDHCLTPWTRAQNAARGVHIRHEVSFQGGDGFLHFASDKIADASYSAICAHFLAPVDETALDDPFYHQTDFVWDFYRSLKAWHEDLLRREDYDNLLSDFAGGFLVKAGSRQKRRGGARGPRALRAISHNATLQQLGVPLNSSTGIGSAIPNEADHLIDLINASPRMRHLLELALKARLITSVPSLRAYATVYSPYLWTGLAHQTEGSVQEEYIRVHRALEETSTSQGIMRIADTLAIDLLGFDALLGKVNNAPSIDDRHKRRLPLHILHAIRQALMMRALTLTATLPTFSDRHGINVDEIIEMVHAMLLDDAIAALCQIFPASRDPDNAFEKLSQGTDAASHQCRYGYDDVHRDVIDPLQEIAQMLRSISLSLSHAYGAYG